MKNNKLMIIFLMIWPFIYLFPLTTGQLVMGNDFELLYYSYKNYIFDFLKDGLIPYWSPSESSGYSLIFNPFAQFFYIPSWMLLFIHKVFLLDFTRQNFLLFTIFGISIYNLGQFLWLRLLNIKPSIILITCLIITLNLKVSEILRFPNAIHTFCWFSWILYGLTLARLQGNTIKSFLIIFFSTTLILTAGYPYFIIYGLFLFLLYFIFISLDIFKTEIIDTKIFRVTNYFKFLLIITIPALLGAVLTSPWLFKVSQILNMTRDRNLKDLDYTNIGNSNLVDHIGSWIFPKLSIAEGWFYNGIIITFVLLIFLLLSIFTKVQKKYKVVSIFFVISWFIIFEVSKAGDSFIFGFILQKVDYLQNLRQWARINIILIPIMALLLSYALQYYEKFLNTSFKINKLFKFLIYFLIFTILIVQFFLIKYDGNPYWDQWQGARINFAVDYLSRTNLLLSSFAKLYQGPIFFIFGFLSSIFVFLFLEKKLILQNKPSAISAILIGFAFIELFFLANIQWSLEGKQWSKNYKSDDNILKTLNRSFEESSINTRVKGNTFYKHNKTFSLNYIDNFGYDLHSRIYDLYFDRTGQPLDDLSKDDLRKVNLFYGTDKNLVKRVFFTKDINHKSIIEFIDDYENITSQMKTLKIQKTFYSGNILKLLINTDVDGYITFVDNWDPNWEIKINGKKNNIIKFLNTYKSVKVKSGQSTIIFNYNPWKINF